MSNLFSESQNEAERLRATRRVVGAILEQFRSRPQSEWMTLLAEVSLALESEWHNQIGEVVAPVPTAQATREPEANALNELRVANVRSELAEVDAANGRSNADRAEALLRANSGGFTPSQMGAVLYGPNDERGTHKARAVVHFLQNRRKVPIVRTADGRWVLRQVTNATTTVPSGPVGVTGPAGGVRLVAAVGPAGPLVTR
jgi:hypothetical protein